MSTHLQQDIRTIPVAEDWQPPPALCEAMQLIATIAVDDSTAVINDRSITFQNFAGF